MLKAVLFDLDDTLLGNDMETFLPGYFSILSEHAQQFLDKKHFLQELLLGTHAMIENLDTAVTNRDAFWNSFCGRTGLDQAKIEPFFEQFYREEFGRLQELTQVRPTAVELMRHCFARELQVVIATNPLFPLAAIEQRLAWAGLPVSEFPYTLVTSYENMHATKPHCAYYQEILATIDCEPDAALMVGNEWPNDIAPAAQCGMLTYWVSEMNEEPPDTAVAADGSGSLEDLYRRFSDGWLLT